jgi:hypothetical protein
MARYKQSVKPRPRRQLATVSKQVYFKVKNIAPSPSKPAIVFSLNKGGDKITLPDVINAKIFKYTHWKDIFALRSLSDSQKREIDGNKLLVFNLTMQRLDEIIRKINTKTNTLANARHFVLKNHVSFKAANNRTLKTGYIVNLPKKYVSIVHCNDVFDEGTDIKKMVSAKVNHIHPFVGEVEEMVDNFYWVDSRVGI